MIINISLIIITFILVLSIARILYWKFHIPQSETYVRISGQNGKKFHEWKDL